MVEEKECPLQKEPLQKQRTGNSWSVSSVQIGVNSRVLLAQWSTRERMKLKEEFGCERRGKKYFTQSIDSKLKQATSSSKPDFVCLIDYIEFEPQHF